MQQTSNVWINTEWTTAAEMKKEQPMHTDRQAHTGRQDQKRPASQPKLKEGGGRKKGRTLSTVAQESSSSPSPCVAQPPLSPCLAASHQLAGCETLGTSRWCGH